jgi:hypothetical protein
MHVEAPLDWLFDDRTECWSVLTTITVGAYLDLIEEAHAEQGALVGQRDVLTTTTAKRIRARMVSDLKQGAVLPPVVIGAIVDDAMRASLPREEADTIEQVLPEPSKRTLSIIDGMQRTAALLEAAADDPSVRDKPLRVEFWLALSVRSMVYRMLVLNTGQVPWTISRQLSVVFAPLIVETIAHVPEIEKMPSPDNPGRRVRAAQYSSDAIVELYIAFSLRKTAIDTREAVSDEFSRLDFVENLSEPDFQEQFYRGLRLMAQLDKCFSRFETGDQGRFSRGRKIFDAQPARIGFIVGVGTHVLGRPGANRPASERALRIEGLEAAVSRLVTKLDGLDEDKLGDFLKLDVLSEILDKRVGQVGRYERAVFSEAFKVLIEEDFNVVDLEQCWRAN